MRRQQLTQAAVVALVAAHMRDTDDTSIRTALNDTMDQCEREGVLTRNRSDKWSQARMVAAVRAQMPRTGYRIQWDNGTEACGTFPEIYATEREAEQAARAWKRGMVEADPNPAEARRCYSWEIVEGGSNE